MLVNWNCSARLGLTRQNKAGLADAWKVAAWTKSTTLAADLVELLSALDDWRAEDGRRHRSGDILVIAFCTVLCSREDYTAMARVATKSKVAIHTQEDIVRQIKEADAD